MLFVSAQARLGKKQFNNLALSPVRKFILAESIFNEAIIATAWLSNRVSEENV